MSVPTPRIKIISGKTVRSGETNPCYVELTTIVDKMATVGAKDPRTNYEYIVLTCDASSRPYYAKWNNKVSEYTHIVRISREDLDNIDSNIPMTITFKFLDGYIETHTINTPFRRFCEIETIQIEADYKNMKILQFQEKTELQEPNPSPVKNTISYYDTIKKVEKKNGAFPCMFYN